MIGKVEKQDSAAYIVGGSTFDGEADGIEVENQSESVANIFVNAAYFYYYLA